MNVQKLAARFQALNLNGSDLSVEVRRENPKDRRVTSVSISGRIDSDCGPDDGLEYRGETFYRIEIDRIGHTLQFDMEHWTNDPEVDCGYPWFQATHHGERAFKEAEAIANTLEALAA